jgi:hypothetical protein
LLELLSSVSMRRPYRTHKQWRKPLNTRLHAAGQGEQELLRQIEGLRCVVRTPRTFPAPRLVVKRQNMSKWIATQCSKRL